MPIPSPLGPTGIIEEVGIGGEISLLEGDKGLEVIGTGSQVGLEGLKVEDLSELPAAPEQSEGEGVDALLGVRGLLLRLLIAVLFLGGFLVVCVGRATP